MVIVLSEYGKQPHMQPRVVWELVCKTNRMLHPASVTCINNDIELVVFSHAPV